jgi:hypothetical protein
MQFQLEAQWSLSGVQVESEWIAIQPNGIDTHMYPPCTNPQVDRLLPVRVRVDRLVTTPSYGYERASIPLHRRSLMYEGTVTGLVVPRAIRLSYAGLATPAECSFCHAWSEFGTVIATSSRMINLLVWTSFLLI